MKKTDYEEVLKTASPNPTISVKELRNKEDRTLLWGYTLERHSHHVYLKDGEIHVVEYTGEDQSKPDFVLFRHLSDEAMEIEGSHLIPGKRLYPEACDVEFCKLLRLKGFSLPFTTWDDNRQQRQFHGSVSNAPDLDEYSYTQSRG